MLFLLLGSSLFQCSGSGFLVWLLSAIPAVIQDLLVTEQGRAGDFCCLAYQIQRIILGQGQTTLKYQKCRMIKGDRAVCFESIRIQKQRWEIDSCMLCAVSQSNACIRCKPGQSLTYYVGKVVFSSSS